jgi:ABC transporter, ATP-binding protein, oligopeptide/dipeptide uptake family
VSLSITDLNVWIGDAHILRGITLEVPDGQHVGIIGSSGSGKSMLSLAIMGLLPEGARVEGSIRWNGRELVGASERELRSLRGSQISMMFQDPATSLDPLMRLGKQIALPLRRHRGLRGAALREAIDRALAEVALPDPARIARSFPYEVSGGQRQRVALAMTLAASPSLLIADEPTTALDVTVQRTVLDLLDEVTRERGVSLLFISHDLPVVARMAGRITDDVPVEVIRSAPDTLSGSARSIASAARALDSVFERIGAVRLDSQTGHAPGEAGEREGEPASSTDNEGNAHE